MHTTRRVRAPLLAALLVATGAVACATHGASASSADSYAAPAAPIPSRDRIGAAELAQVADGTVYDAVVRLRPSFLRSRGVHRSSGDVAVYVDGLYYGGVELLQGIPASNVREVRYLSAVDATVRYGATHGGAGAIMLYTATRVVGPGR
jgi:hypothetical protein